MGPPLLLRRRSAAAAGLYLAAALGILATVFAARLLGLEDFGRYAVVVAAAGFFQTLLDLTVEEALTKYGFRYVEAGDWGRLRRLFRQALLFKAAGGLLAGLALLALAPVADALFDSSGLAIALVVAAPLPLIQSPENVAATALLLRGRYDLRGAYQSLAMALRLVGVALGATAGVTQAVAGLVLAQVVATVALGGVGLAAFRRFPAAPPQPLGDDRRELVRFVAQSSASTGVISLRGSIVPLVLGAVSSATQAGLLRVALAPQTGFTTLSSPVRLILLTEQTRDWERGRYGDVLAGVRRYMLVAGVVVVPTLPVFYLLMPDLVRLVFGSEYLGAVDAARIVLFAAAVHLVLGWTKSLPVTIGRPGLRLAAHGIETAVLLPLVALLGARSGVDGAAVAIVVSSVVFALVWAVFLARIHGDVAAGRRLAPGGTAPR